MSGKHPLADMMWRHGLGCPRAYVVRLSDALVMMLPRCCQACTDMSTASCSVTFRRIHEPGSSVSGTYSLGLDDPQRCQQPYMDALSLKCTWRIVPSPSSANVSDSPSSASCPLIRATSPTLPSHTLCVPFTFTCQPSTLNVPLFCPSHEKAGEVSGILNALL